MSEPNCLISVVIPVYNRRTMLPLAVESVLSQTLPTGWELELIIANDGSDDGSESWAEACSLRESRVKVLHLERTGFPGATRNSGVRKARGGLIAFLDSDDIWLPDKLQKQLPLIVDCQGAPRLSHTLERWVRNDQIVSQKNLYNRRDGDIFQDALWKCTIGPSTVIMDRSLFVTLGGFREDLEVAEDYEFWLRVLCHTTVSYIDQPLTEKRMGLWEQLSTKYGQIEGFRIAALRNLVDQGYFTRHRSMDDQRLARNVLTKKIAIYAAGARKRGRSVEAEEWEQAAQMYRN